MRIPLALLAVLATRLSLAPGATAQLRTPQLDEDEPPRTVAPARIEIGATAGVAIAFPEYGLIASVPIAQDGALEVTASRMPPIWDAPSHLVTQFQVRVPFRRDLRSRKSLVVGLTSISARNGDTFLDIDSGAFVRPHAGVSLQWPVAPTLDFRFDAQGIFTFVGEFPLLPRALTAFVWHPRDSTRRANNRRTSR